MNTTMSVYSQFIHKSRYARWIDGEGRRETWVETVDRYLNYMCDKQCAGKVPDEVKAELRAAILNLEVMPSMRCMMTAGKALDIDNVAAFNCLSGDTLVTTKEMGIVPISRVAGKSVHVVDGNGEWTLAACRNYGRENLMRVSLSSSGIAEDFVLRATPSHRWIMRDGTEKTTSELKVGDSLAFVSFPKNPIRDLEISDNKDYKAGVVHGLVYGDGSAQKKKQICKGFAIRICGDSEDLLPCFSGYPYTRPPSFGGDPVVYLFGNEAIDLKSLPDVETGFFTEEYLIGFLRGWMAADGTITVGGQNSLATNLEGMDWVYHYGPALGFVPRGWNKYSSETNYGVRSEDLYRVEFDRRWLDSEDFIIQRKRDRFKKAEKSGFGMIASIEEDGSGPQETYCFDVPTTHSFLLTKNILTGNCAYLAIDNQRAFDEMLYILMCGTGVGFSVERQFINELPVIADKLRPSRSVIKVEDSRVGWADAYRELVSMLYQGRIPEWDISEVRPAGAKLKTFGGRASGPQPLVDLFKFTIATFKEAVGTRLTSIQCHDLCCKIGEIVVSGGVRRSAEISLSNLSDDRMRHAKDGDWFTTTPWRGMSNNSVCYTEKPSNGQFMREWLSLYESKSGERGVFNRQAAKKQVAKYGRRKLSGVVEREIDGKMESVKVNYEFGCNPCSEIILRSKQFCNLSEVVIRPKDTVDDLKRKVRLATILGTMQATLTNFRYLSPEWKKNTEEEALLGVSLTGIMDNHLMSANLGKGFDRVEELATALETLRVHAVEVNKEWATIFGINQAAAITCVKPSGTVSQLVDCSSGIHARYAKHFIRRVRCDKKDPLAKMMLEQGFPMETDAYKPEHQVVFSFPMAAPKGAVTAEYLMALDQLKMWLIYQNHWCEHKPSMTVYIKEHEWMQVGAWVYDNFDAVSGIAFLPYSGHGYEQAPYEPVSKEEYDELLAKMPANVDWSMLKKFEVDDASVNHKEYACTGGTCELVDLVKDDSCKHIDAKE